LKCLYGEWGGECFRVRAEYGEVSEGLLTAEPKAKRDVQGSKKTKSRAIPQSKDRIKAKRSCLERGNPKSLKLSKQVQSEVYEAELQGAPEELVLTSCYRGQRDQKNTKHQCMKRKLISDFQCDSGLWKDTGGSGYLYVYKISRKGLINL
jgi:hypothetical protein